MAKVKNGLFSLSVNGSVGLVTFAASPSDAFGVQVARRKPNKKNKPRSVDQLSVNERFKNACDTWKLLSPSDQNFWNTHGLRNDLTGRNWFLSEYMNQWIEPPDFPLQPAPRFAL